HGLDVVMGVLELAKFRARGHIPQPRGPVLGGRDDDLAVRAESRRADKSLVPLATALLSVQGRVEEEDLPQFLGRVASPGEDHLPIATEGHGLDGPGALPAAEFPARGRVPPPGGSVLTPADDKATVGAEGNCVDWTIMPPELAEFRAGLGVPQPGDSVLARRD